MVIIYGATLYGKVDEVPNLFYVATRFGHLWYIPLVPLGSHLVIERTEDGWRGVPIGLSIKSVFVAWLRAACVLGAIILGIAAIVARSEGRDGGEWLLPALLAVACAGVFIFTKVYRGFSQASYKRAHQLGEKIGLSEAGKVMLDLHYVIINQQEAEEALEAIAEAEEREQAAQAEGQQAGALADLAGGQV